MFSTPNSLLIPSLLTLLLRNRVNSVSGSVQTRPVRLRIFWNRVPDSRNGRVSGWFRATMAHTTMAHASMTRPLWRMPHWRRSSMRQDQYGAFHYMAQFQYDAFQYGAFHYDAGPVLRISVWRIPVCRSSRPDQCVVVSPSCQNGVCILFR